MVNLDRERNNIVSEETNAAVELSTEAQAIVDAIDVEVGKIDALPKKSNYHNARRAAFKQIRNMIAPPAPKPEKVKATKGKASGKEAAPATETPEIEGETHVDENIDVA